MDISQSLYLEKSYQTLARKSQILHPKTLLYGAPQCGKTSIALDYAKSLKISHKKIAYLDLLDPRIDLEVAKTELLKAYLEKSLQLLIIDHFNPDFTLPNLENIILISNTPHTLSNFHIHQIHNLDFMEYMSFDKKSNSTETLLKNFIKDGNSPSMPFLQEFEKIKHKQNTLKLALQEDFEIFCTLCFFTSQKLTTNQFYSLLKKTQKISKDRIYELFSSLSTQGLIFSLPHLQENKPKKLYLYDFSLPKALLPKTNIVYTLENMFVLELRLLLGENQLRYDDSNFLITSNEEVFLFAPFAHLDFIHSKLSKCPYNNVKVITLDKIEEKSHFEIYSFLEFVLGR